MAGGLATKKKKLEFFYMLQDNLNQFLFLIYESSCYFFEQNFYSMIREARLQLEDTSYCLVVVINWDLFFQQ
jgi:hypothetical protein